MVCTRYDSSVSALAQRRSLLLPRWTLAAKGLSAHFLHALFLAPGSWSHSMEDPPPNEREGSSLALALVQESEHGTPASTATPASTTRNTDSAPGDSETVRDTTHDELPRKHVGENTPPGRRGYTAPTWKSIKRLLGCTSMRPMKKRPQDRLYVYEAFEKRPHILGCLRRLLIGLFGGASGAILLDRHGLWYRNQFAPTSGHSLSRRPRILTGHIALSRPSRRGGWMELKIFLT